VYSRVNYADEGKKAESDGWKGRSTQRERKRNGGKRFPEGEERPCLAEMLRNLKKSRVCLKFALDRRSQFHCYLGISRSRVPNGCGGKGSAVWAGIRGATALAVAILHARLKGEKETGLSTGSPLGQVGKMCEECCEKN